MKGYRCLSFCLNKINFEVANLYTQKEQEGLLQIFGYQTKITNLLIDSSLAVIPTFNLLPILMMRMPALEEFSIDNRRKKIDPALLSLTLQALLKTHRNIQDGSKIRSIRLRSVKIIRESALILTELLPLLPELETLQIIGCDYESDDCYGILSDAIIKSKNLINLTWTRITTKDMKALNSILRAIELSSTLETLDFEYNRGIDASTVKKLTEIINNSETLTHLKLYLNSIPSEVIKEFGAALAGNKVITHLVLNLRKIGRAHV